MTRRTTAQIPASWGHLLHGLGGRGPLMIRRTCHSIAATKNMKAKNSPSPRGSAGRTLVLRNSGGSSIFPLQR